MSKQIINIRDWLINLSTLTPEEKQWKPAFHYRTDGKPFENKPVLDPEKVKTILELYTIDNLISPDFYIERESTHDGTLMFVTNLFFSLIDSILPEIEQYIGRNVIKFGGKDVNIEKIFITDVSHSTVFLDRVSEEKHWPGQRDCMKIGVKVKYREQNV